MRTDRRKRRKNRTYRLPENLPDFWLEDNFLIPLKEAYDIFLEKLDFPVARLKAKKSFNEVCSSAMEIISAVTSCIEDSYGKI